MQGFAPFDLLKLLPLVIATALDAQVDNHTIAPGTLRPDGAYQVGAGVTQPVATFRSACEMPDLARKLRARGDISLLLLVKADGRLGDAQIIKSAGYGMDESTLECIPKWRFKPGTKDERPVAVAFPFLYTLTSVPQPTKWAAGPLVFVTNKEIHPPRLKSASLSDKDFDSENELVAFQFTVTPEGRVEDIEPIVGKDSNAVALLTKNLSAWKFIPASTQAGPIAATAKILFIKGGDYFRYKSSISFRDFGMVGFVESPPESNPAVSPAVITVKVPVRIPLDPAVARKHLLYQVPPEFPAEAKAAAVQGNVSLLVTIAKNGSVKEVKLIAGPAELAPAAISAVKQWRYEPTLVRGEPQEATTVVDIPFKIPE